MQENFFSSACTTLLTLAGSKVGCLVSSSSQSSHLRCFRHSAVRACVPFLWVTVPEHDAILHIRLDGLRTPTKYASAARV